MIGKIIRRRQGVGSFKDSVNYNLGLSRNDTDKVEYVNTLNVFEPSIVVKEMEAVAMENTLSKNPVFNCILSWRENEIPSHEQADEAVRTVLKELGLDECQTHYALHSNTQNLHLHICVNRIHPETFKAIDPAKGWTIKAVEKAARKIEIAQGWEIERSGRYMVTPSGEIIERAKEQRNITTLSQTAKDIETHTGTKSAERIVQEVGAPLIRSAKSWEELHVKLAENGIAFEKKGSGAVLCIGEAVIKASRAGRDISLSKLEKTLGAFCERDEKIILSSPRAPEPTERVETKPRVKNAWTRYLEAKENFFEKKKSASLELKNRQKHEREALQLQQREERSILYSVSWRGKGGELNARRSIMAAKQKGEILALRDRHTEEKKELKHNFPKQFPNFKTWLSQERDVSLSVAFRYENHCVIFSATEETELQNLISQNRRYDLRGYSPIIKGKNHGVMYCREGNAVADFIDYGKKIVFPAKHTEQSVLAALQLASQKWGSVEISGSGEYKRLCVQVAAKNSIRIANPELRDEVQEIRKNLLQDRPRGMGR